MSFKQKLKENNFLRKKVKKLKIVKEYYHDVKDFSNFYMESSNSKSTIEYRMMLIIHSLEKGMCMKDLRPFGEKKCIELMDLIKKYEKDNVEEYNTPYYMSLSILKKWKEIYEIYGWVKYETYLVVQEFLMNYNSEDLLLPVGVIRKSISELTMNQKSEFGEFAISRHSVRNFSDKKIDDNVIKKCIMIASSAPSACNRQMCKVYQVRDKKCIELLNKTVRGISGLDKCTINYFIITYDINAFSFYGERNQGYLNSGLFAMTFINALHYCGIGSCFLQWGNNRSEDLRVKKALNIPNNERIAVAIGAGYYANESLIPFSYRKNVDEIFKVI